MDIKIVKGKPTEEEITAIGLVMTQLEEEAKAKRNADSSAGPRNLWGRQTTRLQPETIFNPTAFRNVRYY